MERPERPKEDIVYADFLADEQFFPEIVFDPPFEEPIFLVRQPSTSDVKKTIVYQPRSKIPEMVEFPAMTKKPLNNVFLDFDDFDAQLERVISKEDRIRMEAIIAELNLDQTFFEPPTGQPPEPLIEKLFEISTDRLFEPLSRPLLKPQPESLSEQLFQPPADRLFEPLLKPQPELFLESRFEPPTHSLLNHRQTQFGNPSRSHWPETTVMTFDELKISPEYVYDFSLR